MNRSKKIKCSVLVVYGIIGILGWYNYLSNVYVKSELKANYLSSNLVSSYVRATVWYHSRGKLQEMRSVLLTEDLVNDKKIKTRITNMLKHRTSAYIRDFNSLDTPIKDLGTWYESHFEFQPFLDEVFDIVFNEELYVEEKVRDIADIMEKYQGDTNQMLEKELRKYPALK